jgi:hypothetical protein
VLFQCVKHGFGGGERVRQGRFDELDSKSNTYMMGILNGLSVIAFPGEDNDWGPTWDIYVQERPQKAIQSGKPQRPRRDQERVDLFQRPLDRR